jgi:hypothetical protein
MDQKQLMKNIDIEEDLLQEIAQEIHAIHAKWWVDINTGLPLDRNVGELIALVHSEISEGYIGMLNNMQDDHLPHRPMAEVELADAAIRIFDFVGGFELGPTVQYHYDAQMKDHAPYVNQFAKASYHEVFAKLQCAITAWLEHERKNRYEEACSAMAEVLVKINYAAKRFGFDLNGAIQEKLEYNINRQDHKHEHRKQEDGKKF